MRINFFGGPGSGKSQTAAWVFSELKRLTVSVELVTEYGVKAWATQKRVINEFDQVYLFGKQMQYEYRNISSGVKNVVTDSPVMLSSVYAALYFKDINVSDDLEHMADEYEKKHPSINIFLTRGDKPYVQEGRYQNYEEAKKLDHSILRMLQDKNQCGELNYVQLPFQDRDAIIAYVRKHID